LKECIFTASIFIEK